MGCCPAMMPDFCPEATMTSTLAAAIGAGTSTGPSASLLDNTFHSGRWLVSSSCKKKNMWVTFPSTNVLDGSGFWTNLVRLAVYESRAIFMRSQTSWSFAHADLYDMLVFVRSALILPILHLFRVCLHPPFWSFSAWRPSVGIHHCCGLFETDVRYDSSSQQWISPGIWLK